MTDNKVFTKIIIDKNSGFCAGVINAIRTAEEWLKREGSLYCLGDIVHNGQEVKLKKQVLSGDKTLSLQEIRLSDMMQTLTISTCSTENGTYTTLGSYNLAAYCNYLAGDPAQAVVIALYDYAVAARKYTYGA